MEFKNATEVLRKALTQAVPEFEEVESMHRAETDASHLETLIAQPEVAVKALGLDISDDSQVHVTVKRRALRRRGGGGRANRIIIIVVKWRNCDTDIFVIVM